MSRPDIITLNSGRVISLVSLRQWAIYDGLLEGLPTVEMNSRLISRFLDEECRSWGMPPYLIKPVETPIPFREGETYSLGQPAALPRIGCVAYFTCLDPARDKNMDFSRLPVVWFQEEYALPIQPGVLAEIHAIDWDRRAADGWY